MSYQNSLRNQSNFSRIQIFGTAAVKAKTKSKPKTKQKLYGVSGQAPAPSKDFFELVVYKDEVIWRKWRIRYTKHGNVVPSEDKYTVEQFLDSDVVQNDVQCYLGDDVLNMALGYLTKCWLPRLPINILANIASYLKVKDVCMLQQISTVMMKRLRKDEIWKYHLHEDFGIKANTLTNNKNSLKKHYIAEVKRRKENEIDWDNI